MDFIFAEKELFSGNDQNDQDDQDDQEEEKMIRTELMNISTKQTDNVNKI